MPPKGSAVSPETQVRRIRQQHTKETIQWLLGELAKLAGAHNPAFLHMDPACAQSLRTAALPFLHDYSCKSDWGEFLENSAEGLDTGTAIKVTTRVRCRNQVMDKYGRFFPPDDEVWRMETYLSPEGDRVLRLYLRKEEPGSS